MPSSSPPILPTPHPPHIPPSSLRFASAFTATVARDRFDAIWRDITHPDRIPPSAYAVRRHARQSPVAPSARTRRPPDADAIARHEVLKHHCALGHPSVECYIKMLPNGLRGSPYTYKIVSDAIGDCLACMQGKMTRFSHPQKSIKERKSRLNTPAGSSVAMDYNTFGETSKFGNWKHALTAVTYANNDTRVYTELLVDKTFDNVLLAVVSISNKIRRCLPPGTPLSVLDMTTDEDTSLTSKKLEAALGPMQVTIHPCTPHEHQTNGRAEVTIRIVTTLTRTYLAYSKLNHGLWPFAYMTAVFNLNNFPRRVLNWKSSNNINNIDYSNALLMPWGSTVLVHTPVSQRPGGKLDSAARPAIFMHYIVSNTNVLSYKVIDIHSGQLLTRSDIIVLDAGPFADGRIRQLTQQSSHEQALSYLHSPFTPPRGRPPAQSTFNPYTGQYCSTDSNAPVTRTIAEELDVDTHSPRLHCKSCTLEATTIDAIVTPSALHDISCSRYIQPVTPLQPPPPRATSSPTSSPTNGLPALHQLISVPWIHGKSGPTSYYDGKVTLITNTHVTVYYPIDNRTVQHKIKSKNGDFTWRPCTDSNIMHRQHTANHIISTLTKTSHSELVNTLFALHVRDTKSELSGMVPASEVQAVLPTTRAEAYATHIRGVCLGEEWDRAEAKEFGSMIKFGAISSDRDKINSAYEAGANIIGTNVVVSVKSFLDAETGIAMFLKLKIRLIIFGNQEKIQPPKSHTHTHTISNIGYNIFLAFTVHYQMTTAVTDCTNAFLHAHNPRQLLLVVNKSTMEAFSRQGLDTTANGKMLIALKAIYGAQDAGDHFTGLLLDILIHRLGFVHVPDDPAFLIGRFDDGIMMLLMHVDDLPMAGTTVPLVSRIIMELYHHLDLGLAQSPMDQVLGSTITQTHSDDGTYSLSRSIISKITDLAISLGLTSRHPVYNVAPKNRPVLDDKPVDPSIIEAWESRLPYQKVIGQLNHISSIRGPALVQISKLGGKRQLPSENDYELLEHLVIYLYSTRHQQRVFKKSPSKHPPLSWAAGDAAFNSDIRGKSRYGEAHYVLGQLVHFSSSVNVVSTTSLSSNGSEIPVLTATAKTAVYIRRICTFLMEFFDPHYPSLHTPTMVLTDNEGAFNAADPHYTRSNLTRHLLPKHFYVRELVKQGLIHIVKVAGGKSPDQPADFFTKLFNTKTFQAACKRFGFYDPAKIPPHTVTHVCLESILQRQKSSTTDK